MVELRFERPLARDEAQSALAAVLEVSTVAQVDRQDIDGTISWTSSGQPTLVLFDAVAGGAGHVRRLQASLPQMVEAALSRVSSCSCGSETSCYSCLRSYSNQWWHQELSRRAAIRVLEGVV